MPRSPLRRLVPWLRRSRRPRGRLSVLKGVPSPQLGSVRDVYVYLPPSYGRSTRCPVIYMQDGQNLFDPAMSFAGSWRVDRTVDKASRNGLDVIVVGIPNAGPARLDEYSPYHRAGQGGGAGDGYLAFLRETVKPLVDQRFRTLPDAQHTGIAGSSMGGLMALYAFLRQPDRWGFAAVLSPSLWFAEREVTELIERSGPPHGRLYLDVGVLEGERHVAAVQSAAAQLIQRGYQPGAGLRVVVDTHGRHHESDWGVRFRRALPFLLGAR